MKMSVLYISYDGMLEPLGQSQVLAYQERLSRDWEIHLLSFEKPSDLINAAAYASVQNRMRAARIHWHPRRYHRRLSAVATTYDILMGVLHGGYLVLRHRIGIVHARSYVSAVMALILKNITGAKFIFDMRGFWADERVDGGLWPDQGRMFRVAKWFERRFLLRADHVVSLTEAAIKEMAQFPYLQSKMPAVSVIPTCADLAKFKPGSAKPEGLVLGYVGSAGTWYLFDAIISCFNRLLLLRPDARLLVINRNEHEYIQERLAAGGVPPHLVELRSAEHADVPVQMARMSMGVFFIKPAFSKQASAPTKLGEFLGCGIPCIANSRVGDMANILNEEKVGVAVDQFDCDALDQGLRDLLVLVDAPDIKRRCAAAAQRHFSLDEGVARYDRIYRSLVDTL